MNAWTKNARTESVNVWTKPMAGVAIMMALAATAGPATAGPYDGSRPFLCAVATIMECDAAGHCERQTPDGVNAPAFIRVDVGGKTIAAGPSRSSALKNFARIDGELVLQGSENGRGWSATINEETGRMAAAVVDEDHTFSLFGACTIP